MSHRLEQDRIIFAVLSTFAALLALTLAHAFHITYPWWAAMTVWLVVQPTRELFVERALGRIAGSAIGALVGALILWMFNGGTVASLLVLAPWLALCTVMGNLFRQVHHYGFVVAGLTASVVIMSGLSEGRFDINLAIDRVVCTFIGIICSILTLLFYFPSDSNKTENERNIGGDSFLTLVKRLFEQVNPSRLCYASMRPVVALMLSAFIWLLTDWQAGSIMVMTATLFSTLFATHEQGHRALIPVFIGSLIGVVAGMFMRFLLLSQTHQVWLTLLYIAPFLIFGAWLMQRPTTSKMAIDLNMAFLLTVQPFHLITDKYIVFNESVAIISGVLIAIVTYWIIVPAISQINRQLCRR